ncbi:MAG TPA: TonB family protein [Bryobacteraceae bacterium]|nr:TonB family protein [Bryobacteraceae bacterium]
MILFDSDSQQVRPEHYVWSFPGSPINVHLNLQTAARLERELPSAADRLDPRGLLLGHASPTATEILDFQPLTGTSGFSQALADFGEMQGNLAPVGFYRIQKEGEELRLSPEDLALAETRFAAPHCVCLLIHPAASGPASACFFFRDDTGVVNSALLEFPLDAELLALAAKHKSEEKKRLTAETSPADASSGRRRMLFSKGTACALIAAALLLTLALVRARLFPEESSPLIAVPETHVSAATLPLGLRAEPRHGDWMLTWNRNSAAVRRAASGALAIEDGERRQVIPLTASMLRGGSVLYSPATTRVEFRLSLSGSSATDSLAVGAPPAQPEASEPAAARVPVITAEMTPVSPRTRPAPTRATPPAPAEATVLVHAPDAIPGAQPQIPEAPVLPQAAVPSAAVDIEVNIDEDGTVLNAALISHGTADSSFAAAALEAARMWRFEPARFGNAPASRKRVLHFEPAYR